MDTILTRQERENLVLDLYFNQNKNTREISQIAKVSFREIGTILDKARKEKETSKEQIEKQSLSTQAYKLFSEGKTPMQVAITLNLREPEARQFYLEYWNLQHLYSLYRIYQEIKANIEYFVNLYRSAVAAGFNIQQVIRLLNIANNDLPAVENRCQQLRREEVSLKFSNQNAAKTFQDLNNQISDEYKTLDQYRLFCKQQKQEIDKILQQKTGLQEYIECFQKNNNAYFRIKETIKLEVKHILTNPRQLLSTALVSLIESSRIDPRKFSALCYNKDITTTTSSTIDNSQYDYESSMNEELLPLDYSSSESFEKMLLDEAEKLYSKIIDDITSKTINFANGKNIWSFQPE